MAQSQGVPASAAYGFLRAVANMAPLTAKLENLQSSISADRLKTMTELYGKNVWINTKQFYGHAFGAGLCLAAGVAPAFGTPVWYDAYSAVTTASKGSEAIGSWFRHEETDVQGELRKVQHHLDKGPERRYSELFQQYLRAAQEMMANARRMI